MSNENEQEDNIDNKVGVIMSDITDSISHAIKGVLEKVKNDVKDDLVTINEGDPKEVKRREVARDIDTRVQKWTQYWVNNGKVDRMTKVTLDQMIEKSMELAAAHSTDAITSEWYRNMIPNVISNIIREPITLGNPLTQLLTPVRFKAGTAISFPAMGAVGNINCDMGEADEYPELDSDMSGSVMTTIGKCGVGIHFTQEALRYSPFDLVTMNVRQAVDVLRRHKEKKAAAMIFAIGSTWIDNDDNAARHSKGRDIEMNFNKTLIIDDLIDASLNGIQEGWRFDTLVVHPMAWQIFAKDPILRESFFRGLAGGSFVNPPLGQAAYFPQLGVNSPYGKNVGPSTAVGLTNLAAGSLSFQIPGYAGFGFNIIITPYAPLSFDNVTGNYKTDIAMIQADQAGLLVIDEELTTGEWTDPRNDMMKMKFRERYSLVNLSQGKAGRVLKNIQITRAYFGENIVTWDLANAPLPNGNLSSSSS